LKKAGVLFLMVVILVFSAPVAALAADGFYINDTFIYCDSGAAPSYYEYWQYCTSGSDTTQAPTSGGSGAIQDMPYQSYYMPDRNEYRVDYAGYPASPAGGYGVHFVSDSGTVYDVNYTTPPTGIFYLTCTGTYTLRMFDAAGGITHETKPILTPQISGGACESRPGNNGGFHDFDSSFSKNPTGGYDLSWSSMAGANTYDVLKNGVKVGSTSGNSYHAPDVGSYSVLAKDAAGGLLGQTDFKVTDNTPPTANAGGCDGCTILTQMLDCPSWNDYMGQWSNMIKSSVPPAPDWNQVAGIMRDKIVPAMGQEIVDRTPEIAKIIADELQSREKPVTAPAPLPSFSPLVPVLTDLPNKIETDLSSNVPDFTPDFTESKPFEIPDPMNWKPDNTDQGYIPGSQDLTAPNYNKKPETSAEPDKGYQTPPAPSSTPPPYSQPSQSCVGTESGFCSPIPYNGGGTAGTPPPYTGTTASPAPTYSGISSGGMPDYQGH
jgi:hypothetical protein